MKRAFLIFFGLISQSFGAGLMPYAHLIVSDGAAAARDGVRVTYLGTNGYQFESNGHALLVDPYFSRVDFWSVALGARIQPNASRINDAMRHVKTKVDAILVTHGHFDHLFDVPLVMSKTHARLIASASSIELVRQLQDAGASSVDPVTPGSVRRIGPWKIRVLSATHDRLFGKVPFDQSERRNPGPPQRPRDWICGQPLAFLIEINGQRIYIDSGGTPAQLPPNVHVDLAILGMALPDSRARLVAALEHLQPRYILPSHQDNFFLPLNAGFQFGQLTDFPRVQRDCARASHGRLILLDYFRQWTLPRHQAAAVSSKSQNSNPKQGTKTQSFTKCAASRGRWRCLWCDEARGKAMRGRIALPKSGSRTKQEETSPWILREALLECDASSHRFWFVESSRLSFAWDSELPDCMK